VVSRSTAAYAAKQPKPSAAGEGGHVDQILVTVLGVDIAPGLYVSAVACLALLALWHWPETAFKPTT
jgi:hypothetical protein